jgi:hypothetical protein
VASNDDTWVSAFLSFADGDYEAGVRLWRKLTGYPLSEDGGFLGVRRLDSGPSGVHLDVHVPDVAAAVGQIRRLGASIDEGDERLMGRFPRRPVVSARR